MASSISSFNSEIRKSKIDDTEDISGKKRSAAEKELEEAKRERDALRK